MLQLKINGTLRDFQDASVSMDLATQTTSAVIKYRLEVNPSGTIELDSAFDEIILGEDPFITGWGNAKPFEESDLSASGSAAWATAVASPVAYYADEAIPQPGDTVFADENNPQAMDPVYL